MIRALSQGGERGCGVVRHYSRWCSAALSVFCALAASAGAAEYPLAPGQKVVGEIVGYVVRPGEGLNEIARKFDLGYTALAAANPGVDQFTPEVGRRLIIPSLYILPDASRQGIVINLAQWRLFYFPPGGDRVETYPLGLSVFGSKTPLGATSVVRKEPNPSWYPPPSIRAERPELPAMIPPGPNNPLGDYALHLGWPRYLIHGTNKPDGVGRNVSHGCVRMYPEDIERLFNEVSVGTPVRSVSQPAGAAWSEDGGLNVRVFPSKEQVEEIDIDHPVTLDPAPGVESLVRGEAGSYADVVDWGAVRQAAQQRTGIPVLVADRSGMARLHRRPAYDRQTAQGYDRAVAQPAYDRAPVQSYAPYYGRDTIQPDDYSGSAQPYPAYANPEAERWSPPPPYGSPGTYRRTGPYSWTNGAW